VTHFWATPTCTPSSTTIPASPTPKSMMTKPPKLPQRCSFALSSGSTSGASPSSAFCLTTVVPTVHTCGGTRAPNFKRTRPYRPQTNGKIERFHRTLPTAGPTPAAMHPRLSVVGSYLAGCTTTTITDPTPHAAASRPSHD
jgi:hypothetical protein